MLDITIFLVGIGLLGIAVFYGIAFLIMLWTGCTFEEAIEKIQVWLSGKEKTSFETDVNFFEDVWQTVQKVIGDKRYNKLVKLSNTPITTPLLSFNYSSGLPYVAICTYCTDEERIIIEAMLKNLILSYLSLYRHYHKVLIDWKFREDLQMPYIMIRYAKNSEQRRIIDWCLEREKETIVTQHSNIIDDTESEDLR